MDKTLRNFIILGIIIVAFSIAYHFIIFLPSKEKARVQDKADELKMRDECYEYAKEKEGGGEVQEWHYEICLSKKGLKK